MEHNKIGTGGAFTGIQAAPQSQATKQETEAAQILDLARNINESLTAIDERLGNFNSRLHGHKAPETDQAEPDNPMPADIYYQLRDALARANALADSIAETLGQLEEFG